VPVIVEEMKSYQPINRNAKRRRHKKEKIHALSMVVKREEEKPNPRIS
jgi:hypothetical protein